MKHKQLYYDELETPLGTVCMLSEDETIIRIDFGTFENVRGKAYTWLDTYFKKPVYREGHSVINEAKQQLMEYFAKRREIFQIPYKLYGTPFQLSVWETTKRYIPYGETASYKQVGTLIKNERAVRAIGGALNKNPCSIIIPCHRVIGSKGAMTGYGGGIEKKKYLLQLEQ